MKDQIRVLDFLRGLAALGVVLFHYSNSTTSTTIDNYLSPYLRYGQYGVQVFFVISGFVIPYSMLRSNYQIKSFFKYIQRRFVRICPPSYLAILLYIMLYYSAILIIKRPIDGIHWPGLTFTSIVGNLTYAVNLLNTDWFLNVFWTLAIEFQFYLIIGIAFPLVVSKKKLIVIATLAVGLFLGFIEIEWFFKYASFFILGIVLFYRSQNLITKQEFIIMSAISIIFCFAQNSMPEFIFGLIAYLIILSGFKFDFNFTNFLGRISYSLYITHVTVGIAAEIVIKRLITFYEYPTGKIILLFIYVGIAIAFSALYYRFIEKPFIKHSKRFIYKT